MFLLLFVIRWMLLSVVSGGIQVVILADFLHGKHGLTNLCVPRSYGGLGFRRAKHSNDTILAKLTWLVVSSQNSPYMIALRSKYKVRGDWMKKEPPKNSSSTWKAIERLKAIICKGTCFTIEDGKSVDVWKDPWSPRFNRDSNSWNLELLEEPFNVESVAAICKISLPLALVSDKLSWISDPKKVFSVNSVYKTSLCHSWVTNPESCWKSLWKSKMHERLKTLV